MINRRIRPFVDGAIGPVHAHGFQIDRTAQSSAKDVGEKVMGFAEQNIANSFEFAQKLVRAKDVQELMALQQEFLASQMKAMSEQAKDLGAAGKSAMASAKSKL